MFSGLSAVIRLHSQIDLSSFAAVLFNEYRRLRSRHLVNIGFLGFWIALSSLSDCPGQPNSTLVAFKPA
jgi:hypothetical protein